MEINEALQKIMTEWPGRIERAFRGDSLAIFIRNEFTKIIDTIVKNLDYNLLVKASPGKGVWAAVPWLSILHPDITKTPQEGVYPVYLFRADGSGVYLSLNQGTTRPINNTSIFADRIRKKYPLENWDFNNLDLRANTGLGRSYEKTNIFCKLYESNNLPDNKELVNDLKTVLHLYCEIASQWERFQNDLQSIDNQENINLNKNEIDIENFCKSLKETGFYYDKKMIIRFISCLVSKQFLLLTGLSGSGKTKIAEAFSHWLCSTPKQICFVSVGADWHNREQLLGFPNALDCKQYVKPETGVLDLIIEAERNSSKPFFLILDEMNLSHVERYFADFLSAMESSSNQIKLHSYNGKLNDDTIPGDIILPKNLFIIGTVNIDETTYMFSPKVLDRANVIEFQVSETEMYHFFEDIQEIRFDMLKHGGRFMEEKFVEKAIEFAQDSGKLKDDLMPFFIQLKELGAEFGYRTASEISTFIKKCSDLAKSEMTRDEIVDAAIMQKLLPKLHGSRNKIEPVLKKLGNLCIIDSSTNLFPDSDLSNVKYKISYEKLKRMHRRVISDGFTSYAEA